MSGKFNPRAIPLLDHYDRLMTAIKPILASKGPEVLAELQYELLAMSSEASKSGDGNKLVVCTLAELGFFAVFSSMADDIEDAGGGR